MRPVKRWKADRTTRILGAGSPSRRPAGAAILLCSALALTIGVAARAGAADKKAASGPAPAASSDAQAVCSAYNDAKYEEALRIAQTVVNSQKADKSSKVEAYKCQACTYVETRKLSPARGSIERMLQLDPTARFSPDLAYPGKVLELYHVVWDSLFPGTMDINTIAVGDFEDNSPYTPKSDEYDYSVFSRAFVHSMIADLGRVTDLKIVDRQRVKQLVDEIDFNNASGFVNPEQAVKAGQFLGAQSFIYGHYQILSDDEALIGVRVVHTATGEVIFTKEVMGEFSGSPKKLLELEKQLVLAVAEGIDEVRNSSDGGQDARKIAPQVEENFKAEEATIDDRDGYTKGVFLAGEASRFEDEGDFKKAYETWQKVVEADPANKDAALRIRALKTMVEG